MVFLNKYLLSSEDLKVRLMKIIKSFFGTVVVAVVVDLEIVVDLGIVVVDLGTVVFVQSLEKCLYSFEMEHLISWNADFVGAQLGRPVPAEHSIY